MKNIHLLPTENSSRLSYNENGVLKLNRLQWRKGTQNIYITSDEEIKEGDWFYRDSGTVSILTKELLEYYESIKDKNIHKIYKIILTTDQDLIKDGVQAIDDEFLEWFVKNPSCERVEVETIEKMIGSFDGNGKKPIYVDEYKIIIPKEEPNQDIIMELQKDPLLKDFDNQVNKKISFLKQKQETLEEAAKNYAEEYKGEEQDPWFDFMEGAKWQQEQDKKLYNEEEVMDMFHNLSMHLPLHYEFLVKEQFKKK